MGIGESDGEVKVEPIFLYERDLVPLEKPTKPGHYRLTSWNGSTELLEAFPLDFIKEEAGAYTVYATAVAYLANVIRLDLKESRFLHGRRVEIKGTPKREAVFSGSIAVYKHGKILGTEIKGYDNVSSGEIWAGVEASKFKLTESGLYRIIFGDERKDLPKQTKEEKISRIESIVKGYEQREEEKTERENRAYHDSFTRGKNQAEERAHGTFGRGSGVD